MVPQRNDADELTYFDAGNKLTPHFDQSLEENLKGWGSSFDSLMSGESCMPAR